MEEVKTAYAWKEAIELARLLSQVCEEFSDSGNVLEGHLREAVVDIPATVAVDIKFGRMATMEPVIRLATELELVHKVYPGIDTGEVPAKLEALIARMSSERFNEREAPELPDESEESTAEQQVDHGHPAGGTIVTPPPQIDQISAPVSRVGSAQTDGQVISVQPDMPPAPLPHQEG